MEHPQSYPVWPASCGRCGTRLPVPQANGFATVTSAFSKLRRFRVGSDIPGTIAFAVLHLAVTLGDLYVSRPQCWTGTNL
jgi:hypothetical protein